MRLRLSWCIRSTRREEAFGNCTGANATGAVNDLASENILNYNCRIFFPQWGARSLAEPGGAHFGRVVVRDRVFLPLGP